MDREAGVNETLKDEVDVVCQPSLSHQKATQSTLSSHLAISGPCCLTLLSQAAAERLPCRGTTLNPDPSDSPG